MEKEKLTIYDYSWFKEVIMQDLTDGRTGILYKTFKTIQNKELKCKLSIAELALLIRENKLIISNKQSLYQNISKHDQMVYFALSNSIEYDVTVCTKNQELALDLVLNGIKVETKDFSNEFVNIGKSDEKNDIYVYDTCAILKNIKKIDFSKNTHYIPVCVLEELISNTEISDTDGVFFKCIYIYNEYPENVKILSTVTSTQRGGRYSYTDLLILYSTICLKNEFRDKNITLVTEDRQLYFEAIYTNLFNVIDEFVYFDGKSHVEEDVSGNIEECEKSDVLNSDEENAEVIETDIYDEEEENTNDSFECNEDVEITDSENFLANEEEYEHYEDDENVTTSLSKLLENTSLYNTVDEAPETEDSECSLDIEGEEENAMTLLSKLVESSILDAVSDEEDELGISDTSFEVEQEKNERPMSLEEKVVKVTNNYKTLPLKKLHRKNVVNLPDIIEHVYSSKFRLMTPVLRRKIEKGLTPETFIVKVGYYITFKNKPTVSYRVVSIDNLTATLAKI